MCLPYVWIEIDRWLRKIHSNGLLYQTWTPPRETSCVYCQIG